MHSLSRLPCLQVLLFLAALSTMATLSTAGCVQTTSVPDNCFPNDATVTGTISGDFFVGFAHRKDPETHKNPTSPTLHCKADVVSGNDALKPEWPTLGGVTVYNKSVFFMEGGSMNGYLTAKDSSKVTMTSGTIPGVLESEDNSVVTVEGGTADAMHVMQHGTITVKGGETASPAVYDKGTLNLDGGKTSELIMVGDDATVNLRGGASPSSLEVYGNATLNVYGTNLKKTLIDAHSQHDRYSQYKLSGMLKDGTPLEDCTLDIENKRTPSNGTPKVHFIETQIIPATK